MSLFKKLLKITVLTVFVINFIFFSTIQAKSPKENVNANNISDYFSGIILLNENKYKDSYKYLKKLDGLEKDHLNYSSKYLYSLVNSGYFNKAFNFSKKLEKEQQSSFESDLIIGIYHFKNLKYDLSNQYFLKAKKRNSISLLENYIADTLLVWSKLNKSQIEEAKLNLKKLDNRFVNLKRIQEVFLSCFLNQKNTNQLFFELTSDSKTDFSRYNYFYANYLYGNKKVEEAKKVIENSLKKNPRNLILNQYKIDITNQKNSFDFDCKIKNHVAAELLYISANALASQSIYPLSNFYLNLSKYLNKNFHTFDTLMAENFYKIGDFSKSKEIYLRLANYGSAFRWYSKKQISRILILEDEKENAINLLSKAYDQLLFRGIYETFDYAEFLKNNENFEKSIKYYSEILEIINERHPLYPEVTDSRGVAYERTNNWKKAEKDLLASLKANPDQAYVINYLAYSWIEQGVKIKKSLEMLQKANKLKSNDPYIIDSLGWALFKLERYKESKDYLQLAVRLMPADPIVNDHYGDVLWKNGEEIQARYYWNYVLNLEKTNKDLKNNIEKKLIKGL